MADTITQANGHSSSAGVGSTSPSVTASLPPEIEATLSRLSAYRSVRGVMILSRSPATTASPSSSGGIVQCTGSMFEEEGGRRYAAMVEGLVAAAAQGVGECDQGDELRLMRIRTKRHELIITPDERYILVVLQDPGQ